MKRAIVLAVLIGALLLVFGLSDRSGLREPQSAEAVTTAWIWPDIPGVGYEVPPGGALQNTELFLPPVCTNCWITRIEPDLIYQGDPAHTDGTSANFNTSNTTDGVWNHHFVVADMCNTANRVISAGNERTVLQYPPGHGYFQSGTCPNPKWALNYHIHNNGSNTRFVAIRLNVTYQTTPLATAVPIWLDIGTTANASQFTVPLGLSDTHTGSGAPGISPDYTVGIQGRIIGMGGHVHDYGIGVSAFNTGAGDRPDDWICTSRAGYGAGSRYLPTGGAGTVGHPSAAIPQTINHNYHENPADPPTPDNAYHIQSMEPCTITERMSVVCPGDVIKLHAQYNNTDDFPIADAMGIMVMFVATPPNVPDADGDGNFDGCDSGDFDGDLFSDRVEYMSGNQANDVCPDNSTDPAWPADLTNNKFVDTADIAFLTSDFGLSSPPEETRHNIAPDALPNTFIDTADIAKLTSRFGDGC